MNLSIMLFPYHGAMDQGLYTPETLVKTFKDAGAVAIETMMGWADKSPVMYHRLLDAMKDQGIAVSCHDIGVNLVHTDSQARAAALDKCRREIEYAHHILQAPNVLIYSSNVQPGLSIEHARKLYGEALGEMAEFASTMGVTVTIEDFDPYPAFVCSAESCMQVLEIAGPKAKLCFDTGNFLNACDKPAEIFGMVRSRIGHVHVKEKAVRPHDDNKGNMGIDGVQYKGALLGEGIAQIAECEALLKADGYAGYLSVEAASNKLDEAVHGLKYLGERM